MSNNQQADGQDIVAMFDAQIVKNGRSMSMTIKNVISSAMGLFPGHPLRVAVRRDGVFVVVPMESTETGNGGTLTQPRVMNLIMDRESPLAMSIIPEGRRIRTKHQFLRNTLGGRDQKELKKAQ